MYVGLRFLCIFIYDTKFVGEWSFRRIVFRQMVFRRIVLSANSLVTNIKPISLLLMYNFQRLEQFSVWDH